MYSDQQLVKQVLGGDQQAFGTLVEQYQHSVFNLAYRTLGEAREAEDATQETFLRAYRNLASYDPTRSFKTWLLSIVSNYAIDQIRKWRHLSWLDIEDDTLPQQLTAGEPAPEEAVIRSEREAALNGLLMSLPPEYRAVVVMYYWDEMPCAEIAAALDTSESAIKSRLFRAREMMAREMQRKEAARQSQRRGSRLMDSGEMRLMMAKM